MRLLHVSTLEFCEFFDADTPRYSILSHRWTSEEVTHQQFLLNSQGTGYGYEKIAKLCDISRWERLEWCWIDTVCIDKSSSSELSEAINSMFKWYERAEVCYVFLKDVTRVGDEGAGSEDGAGRHRPRGASGLEATVEESFRRSDWWSRGWTLQELIAPRSLRFYDASYTLLGERSVFSELIHQVTGIRVSESIPGDDTVARHNSIVRDTPFATKMSWVSRRQTSRSEDLAYCMLGLLGINMPLLYGEGLEQAFMRLQTEYLLRKGDDSVFVWNRAMSGTALPFPLLARSPSAFGNVLSTPNLDFSLGLRRSLRGVVSTFGVELELPVPEVLAKARAAAFVLYELATWMAVQRDADAPDTAVPIFLKVLLEPRPGNIWQGRLDAQVVSAGVDLSYADISTNNDKMHSVFGVEVEHTKILRPAFIFRRDQRFNDSITLDPLTRSQKARACQDSSWWKRLRYSNKKVISRRVAFQQDPRREATTKQDSGTGIKNHLIAVQPVYPPGMSEPYMLYASPQALYPGPGPNAYPMYQAAMSSGPASGIDPRVSPMVQPLEDTLDPQNSGPWRYQLYEAPQT